MRCVFLLSLSLPAYAFPGFDTPRDVLYQQGVGVVGGSGEGTAPEELQMLSALMGAFVDATIEGATEGDRMGYAITGGDFDCDGVTDLAISIPGEGGDEGGISTSDSSPSFGYGRVVVVYDPLGVPWAEQLHQDMDFVPGGSEVHDAFGLALAAGDFDGDACDDLAVGVPGENGGHINHGIGMVHVFYGDAIGGVNRTGSQAFSRDGWFNPAWNLFDVGDASDQLGWALAAADFDRDGRDDLAIGAPGDDSVHLLYGTTAGLTTTRQLRVEPGGGMLPDLGVLYFGYALAAGDFDRDGHVDLAIGAPGNGVHGTPAVTVVRGAATGLTTLLQSHLSQATPSMHGEMEPEDAFGAALFAADLDRDGDAELIIGSPGEDEERYSDRAHGGVHVCYGRVGLGIRAEHCDVVWGEELSCLDHNRLGTSLAAADLDGDGHSELIAGAPRGSGWSSGHNDIARFIVFSGTPTGPDLSDATCWDQDDPGLAGGASTADDYGFALWAGDLDADGQADLAVGEPGRDNEAGGAHVLAGRDWFPMF